MKLRRLSIGVLACLFIAPALADPPLLRLSPPRASYELKAAAPAPDGTTWLAGSVTAPGGETDAFLTHLDSQGDTIWEKRFGAAEGGDAVQALEPLPDGGALLSCGLSAALPEAWGPGAPVDFTQQVTLATVDGQGKLGPTLELRAEAPASAGGSAYEPSLQIRCLAVTPGGELLAGGRWTGDFRGMTSAGGPLSSQALLLRLSPELKLLEAIPLQGDSLDLLTVLPNRIVGAGVADSSAEDPMAPPSRRAVAWDLSGSPREIWRGDLHSNSQCLQLDGSTLLVSDNDSDTPYRVELGTAAISRLPEGSLATAWLGDSLLATGYRQRGTGTELSEVGGAMLWEKRAEWNPVLRWGTAGRDFVPFAFSDGNQLTLVGTSDGDFPGSPAPGVERWVWVRLRSLPGPKDAVSLGTRAPGQTRAELASQLQELTFLERPGYDHFAGFYPLASGPPAALITGERTGFDGWSLCQGTGPDRDTGSGLRELAAWSPATPPVAPMEPQIFPRLNGDVVLCRDVRWTGPDSGLGTPHWTRLQPDGQVAAQGSVAGTLAHECHAVVATGDGRCVWFGLEWNAEALRRMILSGLDANGRTLWSEPFGGWREFVEQEWLSATRLPDGHLAALARVDGHLELQTFTPVGKPGWKLDFGERFGHTLGVAGQHLLVISSREERSASLEVEAVDLDGVPVWTSDLALPGPARAARIVDAGDEILVVGGVEKDQHWRGFAGAFRGEGKSWGFRLLEVGPDLGLQDAFWRSGELWVGGELTRDYVTDVFWGRLK